MQVFSPRYKDDELRETLGLEAKRVIAPQRTTLPRKWYRVGKSRYV